MYRTPCKYPGKNIAFHVNEGSTNYWLSLLVEFEGGDGDVGSMHIREVPLSTLLLYLVCTLCFFKSRNFSDDADFNVKISKTSEIEKIVEVASQIVRPTSVVMQYMVKNISKKRIKWG